MTLWARLSLMEQMMRAVGTYSVEKGPMPRPGSILSLDGEGGG